MKLPARYWISAFALTGWRSTQGTSLPAPCRSHERRKSRRCLRGDILVKNRTTDEVMEVSSAASEAQCQGQATCFNGVRQAAPKLVTHCPRHIIDLRQRPALLHRFQKLFSRIPRIIETYLAQFVHTGN
ncbi:hypothetical protein [Pantoea sp. 18069]|uniref:hypothetical protein n=1 Tax=Pantoea sp. 18069 TaxID=2681415 RepID=UPI00135C7F4E|nr:hypothetical protein [Pantoea sp. 18069]